MVWRVSTKEKKNLIEIEAWVKGDLVAERATGRRWGTFDYDKRPDFDFENQAYEQSVSAGDLGDYSDRDLTDACWEEWTWPEDMDPDVIEEIENHEDYETAMEDLDWYHDDTTYWLKGPLDINFIPDCYQKKPVVIRAVQFTEDNLDALREFCGDALGEIANNEAHIKTLEDGTNHQVEHIATIGDYIIKGVKGEFYPCKPDIFDATYQLTWLQPTE